MRYRLTTRFLRNFLLRTTIGLVSAIGLATAGSALADPIRMASERVTLSIDDPALATVGALRFRGGLSLTSDDPRFGGLSGLLVASDGRHVMAVSDKGYWVTMALRHDRRGDLAGVAQATLVELRDRKGARFASKRQADAEALARANGHVVIAFENVHRLRYYRARATGIAARAAIERAPPRGRDFSRQLRGNAGIEALTVLDGDRLFALPEGRKDAVPRQTGWIIDGQRWRPLTYLRHGLFRPTGAATLASGDVLVLERRFSWAGGMASRIVRVRRQAIRPGAEISGHEIAVLGAPLIAENFEGIAVREGPDGGTLIYLISDDNYNFFQRTLLLMFEWRGAGRR